MTSILRQYSFFRSLPVALCLWLINILGAWAQDDRLAADGLIRLLPHMPADSAKVYAFRDIAYYLQNDRPDSALYYAKLGEKLARVLGRMPGQVWNLNQQGIAWEGMDRLDSAMVCYQRAHQLAIAAGDQKITAQMYNTMGASWFFQGAHSKALEMYDRALDIFQ